MDLTLLLILLIPIAISVICKYGLKWDISLKEFGVQLIVGTLALSVIWFAGRYSAAGDQEVWNGHVTGKHVERFSCPTNTSNPCRNGYSCNCVKTCSTSTDSKGNRTESCTETCDTCYRYPWEQNWYADTTLRRFEIDRVDAQGRNEPKRYAITFVGDPVSETHGYQNWVKGSSDSLYAEAEEAEERYASLLPTYQQRIYDYYKIDRLYTPNVKLQNPRQWNDAIGRMLGPLGKSKQINFNLVVVEGVGREYAQALRRKWNGFKKNEAVLVVGLRGGKIAWAESMSWSKKSIYDVNIRNLVEGRIGTSFASIDPAEFTRLVSAVIIADYERRPMKEFEYLKGEIPPPAWMVWLSVILATLFGAGTSYLFNRIEL